MSEETSHNQEPAPHPQNHRAQSKASSMETKCEPPKTGQSTPSKITPRPTYISGAAAASDLKLPQQMLSKRNTIDINDYFVSGHFILPPFSLYGGKNGRSANCVELVERTQKPR